MAYKFVNEGHPDVDAVSARIGSLSVYTGSGADLEFRVCRFSAPDKLGHLGDVDHAVHAFAKTAGMSVRAVTDWEEMSCEEARQSLRDMVAGCRWQSSGSAPTAEESLAVADQFLSLFPPPSRFFRPQESVDYSTPKSKNIVSWGLGAVVAVHGSRIGVLWMQGWD